MWFGHMIAGISMPPNRGISDKEIDMRVFILLCVILFGSPAVAQSWSEPARGTATRSALMDALRPHVMWVLGSPIEFVVYDLRQSGNLAFASVYPQRPGGAEINLRETPAFQRGDLEPEFMDGLAVQALYYKSGQTWVAVHWALGATDVWYAYDPICASWRKVIPDACEGL